MQRTTPVQQGSRPAPPGGRPGKSLPPRTRVATVVGSAAGRLARAAGRGQGVTAQGRAILALDPGALTPLSRGRHVALVSGTNGKTTTTRMLADAMRTAGPVAATLDGSNLPPGVAAALAGQPGTNCVLEVDELYLARVSAAVSAETVVLLNLSRDQLDRTTEVRAIERRWYAMLSERAPGTVVANADDPLVVSAVPPPGAAGGRTVWVAAGHRWSVDASSCGRCGSPIGHTGDAWACTGCELARPEPDWTLVGDTLTGPDGTAVTLALRLPGSANRSNAAMAIAAAATMGVDPRVSAAAAAGVSEVDGRYRRVRHRDHDVRLLLAKNPAGWRESLDLATESEADAHVLSINARTADGTDPSWLWDVDFTGLTGRRVAVIGDRAADLSVRLLYAGVPHTVHAGLDGALAALPDDPVVDVHATYTAFRDLLVELNHD